MGWAAAAACLAALIVLLAGPRTIRALVAWNAGQPIREDAPSRHRSKAGTPTMGGVLCMGAAVVAAALLQPLTGLLAAAVVTVLGFGAIGLVDDLRKVRRGRNLGLRARERLAAQLALAALVTLYVMARVPYGSTVALPWVGRVELGWLYLPLGTAYLVGFVNAVNLADGLDGLAAGLGALAAGAYAAVAFHHHAPGLGVFAAATSGAALAFLWFNAHPAQVIMGDVGSNALGAALGAFALLTKTELVLVVVGALFVAEAASVLAQVAYFKATGGRRIFRMSPLHHHFELGGWTETQIVVRFWLLGALAALVGLVGVF